MCNSNKFKSTLVVFAGVLICLTAFSALLLSASKASADTSTTANVSVTVPAICSLTVDPDEHSITVDPGDTYTIGHSDIKAVCNDPAGLAVYAVGYTNDTYGNNDFVATVNNNTYTIPSDNVANPTTSQWNMTLAPVSGTFVPTIVSGFDQASVVPTLYTKVAYRNSATDMGNNATGANFTATFRVYVDNTQAAGTYTAKVKFLLIHPNVLSYDDQTGEPATFASSTLPSLQDVSSWGSSIALGETVEAVDNRDGQTYQVKRLKMNAAGTETALWMSNLNLGASPLTVDLTSTNTHLASGVSDIPAATFNSWVNTAQTDYNSPKFVPITASNSATSSATDSTNNKYGTLYNYAAASAGTYVYPEGEGTGNATSDLCPSGWRLPTGGNGGEFEKLTVNAYEVYDVSNDQWNTNGLAVMEATLGFSRAGNSGTETPVAQGVFGGYWSSTFYSHSEMYQLRYNNHFLYANSDYVYRPVEYSVRCIAQ